jgi:hypothetical protein
MQSIWNLLNNVLDHNTQAKFEYVYPYDVYKFHMICLRGT